MNGQKISDSCNIRHAKDRVRDRLATFTRVILTLAIIVLNAETAGVTTSFGGTALNPHITLSVVVGVVRRIREPHIVIFEAVAIFAFAILAFVILAP